MLATRKLEQDIWSIALVKSHQNEVLECSPGKCLLSDDGAWGGGLADKHSCYTQTRKNQLCMTKLKNSGASRPA